MSSFGVFNHQARRIYVAVALVVATVIPTLAPVFATAAQVTARSIALSSSSKSAMGVTYSVNFTAVASAGAFVIDFCNDSPIIGETCTAPTGFSAASAASITSGFTDVTGSTSKIVVAGTINASDNVSVALTGINNPSVTGPLYARIVTFDTKAHASAYTSTTPGTGKVDEGGVAMSITDTVGVAGAVLESMTFCVSGAAITAASCGGTLTQPVLKLGEAVPGTSTVALDPGHVSTGDMYTQISTNAASGAVVSLKSGVSCGGLKRVEATACDIVPALAGGIASGQAKFGVKTATATSTSGVSDATGTLQPAAGSIYNNTTYALNYLANGTSGITSAYGDPFLDTNDLPINNQNMKLTFGASISNNTPAGLYSNDLSLIATGKF